MYQSDMDVDTSLPIKISSDTKPDGVNISIMKNENTPIPEDDEIHHLDNRITAT